jgi:hypothetical protein
VGRHAIKDGLEVFRQWLVDRETLSPTTARSYTSHVRTALRALRDNVGNEGAVASYFDQLYLDKPFTYNNTKRGWMLFRKWASTERGIEVASPGNKQSKLKNTLDPLPPEVRQAILDLLEVKALPLSKMPFIVWADVEVSRFKTQADVRVPGGSAEFWRVDKTLLDPLRDYAQVGEFNGDVPLIPTEPGGLDPYNYRALRREVAAARADESEQARRLRLMRPDPNHQPAVPTAYVHDPPTPGTAEADHFPTRTDADLEALARVEEDTDEPQAPTVKAPGVPPGMEPGQEPDWWKNLTGQ